MTQELIGYQLLDADNDILQSWGGSFGQTPEVPSRIDLPNGDQVHCPSLGGTYDGCRLVEWQADPPEVEPIRDPIAELDALKAALVAKAVISNADVEKAAASLDEVKG